MLSPYKSPIYIRWFFWSNGCQKKQNYSSRSPFSVAGHQPVKKTSENFFRQLIKQFRLIFCPISLPFSSPLELCLAEGAHRLTTVLSANRPSFSPPIAQPSLSLPPPIGRKGSTTGLSPQPVLAVLVSRLHHKGEGGGKVWGGGKYVSVGDSEEF